MRAAQVKKPAITWAVPDCKKTYSVALPIPTKESFLKKPYLNAIRTLSYNIQRLCIAGSVELKLNQTNSKKQVNKHELIWIFTTQNKLDTSAKANKKNSKVRSNGGGKQRESESASEFH